MLEPINADDNSMKDVLYLIQQAGTLMLLPRTHIKHFGGTFDTVASHSYQTSLVSYCLTRMEGYSHEEGLKSIAMGIFHDLLEARTGDLDFIAKHYLDVNEPKAIKDQFNGIPFAEDMKNVITEYENRVGPAAVCARDADSLVQMQTEWMLMWQGNNLAKKWFDSDFNDRVPGFKTESARKLAIAMRDSNPNEWWWSQFLENDTAKDKEKLLGKNT